MKTLDMLAIAVGLLSYVYFILSSFFKTSQEQLQDTLISIKKEDNGLSPLNQENFLKLPYRIISQFLGITASYILPFALFGKWWAQLIGVLVVFFVTFIFYLPDCQTLQFSNCSRLQWLFYDFSYKVDKHQYFDRALNIFLLSANVALLAQTIIQRKFTHLRIFQGGFILLGALMIALNEIIARVNKPEIEKKDDDDQL